MSRKEIRLVLCDRHLYRGGEQVAAVFSEVVTVGSTSRRLELCAACRDEIIGDLVDSLRRYGTRDDVPRARQAHRRAEVQPAQVKAARARRRAASEGSEAAA